MSSIVPLVRATVERVPDGLAYEDPARRLSFAELWREALSGAEMLFDSGVREGDKVALLLNDDASNLIALLAVWMSRAMVVPINVAQTSDKIEFILEQVEPDRVLVSREVPAGQLAQSAQCLEWPKSFSARRADDNLSDLGAEANAMILYTSGTTGVPKGVLHSHDALVTNAIEMSAMLALDENDRLFLNIPFCFSNTISHLLMALFRGATIVSNPKFMLGDALLQEIVETRATGFGGVPAHYVRIADVAEGPIETDLRFIMNSGDHLPINVLKKLAATFEDVSIFCAYGISECAPRVCCLEPALLSEKMGSVGRPLPSTTVTVRDEEGESVPTGELGEVYVESRCLMREYYANPQATAKSMTSNGFRTGDMGYLDDDGCLFLTGRNDSVFKSGGEKVSCRYIEEDAARQSVICPGDVRCRGHGRR